MMKTSVGTPFAHTGDLCQGVLSSTAKRAAGRREALGTHWQTLPRSTPQHCQACCRRAGGDAHSPVACPCAEEYSPAGHSRRMMATISARPRRRDAIHVPRQMAMLPGAPPLLPTHQSLTPQAQQAEEGHREAHNHRGQEVGHNLRRHALQWQLSEPMLRRAITALGHRFPTGSHRRKYCTSHFVCGIMRPEVAVRSS